MSSLRSRVALLGLRIIQSRRPKNLPIEQQREAFDKMMSALKPPAEIQFNSIQIGEIPAVWAGPADAPQKSVVLYLHGGAYVMGSPVSYRQLVGQLARSSGRRVLVPHYRLAPEHPFPAAVEDAVAVYQWLLQQGYEANQIVVGGDSAGGGLTLALLLSLRDAGQPLPAAAFLISPWTDLSFTGKSLKSNFHKDHSLKEADLRPFAAQYVGAESAQNPLISPIYADLKGLPPLLIQAGEREILLDDAQRIIDLAQKATVPCQAHIYPDMWHVMGNFLPESRTAFHEIGQFVRSKTAHP